MKLPFRKISLLCILVLIITSCIGIIANASEPQKLAEPTIDDLAQSSPEVVINAVISFNDFTNPGELLLETKKDSLNINGFYHAFKGQTDTFTGGYNIPLNKNLSEEIINQYYNDYSNLLDDMIGTLNETIQNTSLETEKQARINLLNDFKQRKADFEDNGIKVYAIKVSGKSLNIKNFIHKYSNYKIGKIIKDNQKFIPELP